jgi:hypothetical protein
MIDIRKIIAELREERACLDEALMCLERLELKQAPRRGRPPLWMKAGDKTPKTEERSDGSSKRHGRTEKMETSSKSVGIS